jgi:photosystem II stability/assembly factor-like uncharacterized protein
MSITITDVGPGSTSFSTSNSQQSFSGRILSLALGADGVRMYVGSHAGVWRSDDAGRNWRQLTRPQPGLGSNPDVAGALYAPRIFDLAASPADVNLVLAAATGGKFVTSRDGIYRTTDGGATWALVLGGPSVGFINEIVFAPDDPTLVYAALGGSVAISDTSGEKWRQVFINGTAQHIAVAPRESNGRRRVYAVGGDQIWYSTDGGNTWVFDPGTSSITTARRRVSDRQIECQIAAGQKPSGLPSIAGATANAVGSGAHILAVEPGNPARVYLAALGAANGPTYYNKNGVPPDGTFANLLCERLAGEASLWFGDFSRFDTTGAGAWKQLPGPPVLSGGSTPSGNTFVITKQTSTGFLLFFADQSHVFVSEGRPTANASSWHRLEGKDLSVVAQAGEHSNQLFVHADPHALVSSKDFEITLKKPTGVTFPYNQNSVLNQFVSGTIWMANDGGVYWSEDGGQNWKHAAGLNTLDPVNLAGLFGLGDKPALYMGTGDNDNFYTRDGGKTWRDALSLCGDCDAWFTDTAQPTRALEFLPRDARVQLVLGLAPFIPGYPDAGNATALRSIPPPKQNSASSGFVLRGSRPIIQTMPGEAPLPDGDYVFTGTASDGARVLYRTRSISSIKNEADWDAPAKAERVGPPLPIEKEVVNGVSVDVIPDVVQVGGGHSNPVFYIANRNGKLWRLDKSAGVWKAIVPGGSTGATAEKARQFFVDPYNPKLIYLLDRSAIRASLDGGESWFVEPSLTQAATAGGLISVDSGFVLTDMLFVRNEPTTRFAFGRAGVMFTTDGFQWNTILSTLALPGYPESGFFDPVSNPSDRALYVNLEGRSVLRLSPIPAPEIQPPPVFGLFELAAILGEA